MPQKLKETDELPILYRDRSIIVRKPIVATPPPEDDDPSPDDDDATRQAALPGVNPPAKAKKPKRRAGSATEAGQAGGDDSDEEDGDGAVISADESTVGKMRSYPISLSSEIPVERWYGNEILQHTPDAVDLSRADGMPLLMDHDSRNQVGVITGLHVGKDRKLRGNMMFSRSATGVEQDVVDGIRKNMSVGYRISKYEYEEGKGDKPDTYRATRWTPMEATLTSVPADHTIGVNRAAGMNETRFSVMVTRSLNSQGASQMPDPVVAAPNGAAAAPIAGAAAADIARLAETHRMLDRLPKWLADGTSIEDVRTQILEARATQPIPLPPAELGDNAGLKLSPTEARQYSYSRAILAAANMAEGRRETSFETEISDDLVKRMPQQFQSRGGLLIPTTLRGTKHEGKRGAVLTAEQARALEQALTRAGTIDSQTANAIKEVVFTEYGGELIEILRNMAKVVRMGARVLTGLSSPIGFPRQTGDVTATWVAENSGSNVASSNVTTDIVTLTPRSLMATTAYSRQLLVQSSVDVESMVRASIAAKHALAWDLAGIHGTGINSQPLGIYNQPNVQTTDFSNASYSNTGQLIAFTGAVHMQELLATANALFGTLGYLTTPGIAADAITTLRFPAAAIAQGGQLWNGTIDSGEMAGYKAESTNQVSATMGEDGAATGGSHHGLIFGNWQELLIGQFGGAMEMIVDPYSLKKQALIEVASFQMADVAVRHPVSFCVAIDLNA
jgi:HK97 family phage major capsid protein